MRLAWSRQEPPQAWRASYGGMSARRRHKGRFTDQEHLARTGERRLWRYGPLIGPRVRLWQAKDVSDLDVCRAVAASKAHPEIRFADSFLMEWCDVPAKVAHAALERAYDRGLLECGVSVRSGWLTDKGRAELAKTGALR